MERTKPNILWLMSDQHNANCIGAAGNSDVRTPNLDALAARGTRFSHAYCNNPICGPSRCSFITGQHVKTHGVSGNFILEVDSEWQNVARQFQRNGYQTALIGKAHIPKRMRDEGFEHVRLSDLCDADWDEPLSCHYFNDLVEAGLGDLYDQGRMTPDHEQYTKGWFVSELPEEYSLEAWTGRKAVEFLEHRDETRPFFLKVSFQRPHDPYAPPASRANDYDPSALSLPESIVDYFENGFSGKPQHQRDYIERELGGYPYRFKDEASLREALAAYYTLITMMDEAIGEVFQTLENAGELENTIIVYTADHGDFAGEHGMMLKNLGIYEAIHRIPFIWAGPGIEAGQVRAALAESIDLYPTLASLAGIETEDGVEGACRLGPQAAEPPEYTICDFDYLLFPSRVYAVRDERYRFVQYDAFPDDGELYDCTADPGELNNLFANPDCAAKVAAFQTAICAFKQGAVHTHAVADDGPLVQRVKEKPTLQLHQFMAKWSELTGNTV